MNSTLRVAETNEQTKQWSADSFGSVLQLCVITSLQVYPAAAAAAAAAAAPEWHNIGAAVSAVPACTAGMQWFYCSHCLMPSVHSRTATEKKE